jgi:hypothetical protein
MTLQVIGRSFKQSMFFCEQILAMAPSLVRAPLVDTCFRSTLSVLVVLAPHCLEWNLILGHVVKYVHVAKAFA